MPPHPGKLTLLVVTTVEDTTRIGAKGVPASTDVVTPLPGCKLVPESGAETVTGGTDYSRILWRIVAPPLPVAATINAGSRLWYDDAGQLANNTLRSTYEDPTLGPRDVAEFNVEQAWPHFNGVTGAVEQYAIVAKSEVG